MKRLLILTSVLALVGAGCAHRTESQGGAGNEVMTSSGTSATTSTTTTTDTSGHPIMVRPGEKVIISPGPGQQGAAVGAPENAVSTTSGGATSYSETQTTTTTQNTTTGYYGTGERYLYPVEHVDPSEKGYQAAGISPPIRVDANEHFVRTYH